MTESVLAKWEGTNYTRMCTYTCMYVYVSSSKLTCSTSSCHLLWIPLMDTRSFARSLFAPRRSPFVPSSVPSSMGKRYMGLTSIGMQCPERNARHGTQQHRYTFTLCDTGLPRRCSLPAPPHLCPQYTIERASNALKGEGIEDGVEWLSDAIKKTAPRQAESKFK